MVSVVTYEGDFASALLSLTQVSGSVVTIAASTHNSIALGSFTGRLPRRFIRYNVTRRSTINVSTKLTRDKGGIFIYNPTYFCITHDLRRMGISLTCDRGGMGVLKMDKKMTCKTLKTARRDLRSVTILHAFPNVGVILPYSTQRAGGLIRFLVSCPRPICIHMKHTTIPSICRGSSFSFTVNGTGELLSKASLAVVKANRAMCRTRRTTLRLHGCNVSIQMLSVSFVGPYSRRTILGTTSRANHVVAIRRRDRCKNLKTVIARVVSRGPMPIGVLKVPSRGIIRKDSSRVFTRCKLSTPNVIGAALSFLGWRVVDLWWCLG